jgi:hypothetical protein
MGQYRVYALSGSGGIGFADWIDAETDEEAVAKARQIEHGAVKCEIWHRNRQIAELGPDDLVA